MCLLAPVMLSAQSIAPEGAPWFADDPHFYWNDHGKTLSIGFTFGYQGISSPSEEIPVMYGITVLKGVISPSGDTSFVDWTLVANDTAISNSTLNENSKLGPGGETNFVTLQKNFQKDSLYLISVVLQDDSGQCQYDKVLRALDGAPLSINDQVQSSSSVFPNPFSNTLSITTQETQGGLRITDVTGREIYWSELHSGSNSVNTEDVPAGIYIASLVDSKGLIRETKRISKE